LKYDPDLRVDKSCENCGVSSHGKTCVFHFLLTMSAGNWTRETRANGLESDMTKYSEPDKVVCPFWTEIPRPVDEDEEETN